MVAERFPVEASHIMMFARAIGDPNPVYADAEYAARTEVEGIPAPPTFAQARAQFDPDYSLRPKIGEPWFGSGKEPTGDPVDASTGDSGGGDSLHAEQHFVYHRPLRAGDVLSLSETVGETWEKEGRRAGQLVFVEKITEYRDPDCELVVTARSVSVQTERSVESEEVSQ